MVARHRLSVVIPTHNTCSLTTQCIRSVAAGSCEPLEIVVVDDASEDDTAAAITSEFPGVIMQRLPRQSGFAVAANIGVGCSSGSEVLILNSDTELASNALQVFADAFDADTGLGIAGGSLHYPDGSPQWSAGRWPTTTWLFASASGLPAVLGRVPGYRKVKPEGAGAASGAIWVGGAAMAVRRSLWQQVGPFDERYEFYCQDLDLCRTAVEAGWNVSLLSAAQVVHHHGASISSTPGAVGASNPSLLWSDLLRYTAKHEGAAGARAAYRALVFGGRLRVASRRAAAVVVRRPSRAAWRAQTAAYSAALRALAKTRLSLERPG